MKEKGGGWKQAPSRGFLSLCRWGRGLLFQLQRLGCRVTEKIKAEQKGPLGIYLTEQGGCVDF